MLRRLEAESKSQTVEAMSRVQLGVESGRVYVLSVAHLSGPRVRVAVRHPTWSVRKA